MAIEKGVENIELMVEERTWRIEIFCDHGVDPMFVAHREKVWIRKDGTIMSREILKPVNRSLSSMVEKKFNGFSTLEIAEVIAKASDDLAIEDQAEPRNPLIIS